MSLLPLKEKPHQNTISKRGVDGKGPNSAQAWRKSINSCSSAVKNLQPDSILSVFLAEIAVIGKGETERREI